MKRRVILCPNPTKDELLETSRAAKSMLENAADTFDVPDCFAVLKACCKSLIFVITATINRKSLVFFCKAIGMHMRFLAGDKGSKINTIFFRHRLKDSNRNIYSACFVLLVLFN